MQSVQGEDSFTAERAHNRLASLVDLRCLFDPVVEVDEAEAYAQRSSDFELE